MVNNAPLMLGSLAMGMASSYGTMILGRFLIGIGCGTVTVIVPMYLAEISPAELRGTLGTSLGSCAWYTLLSLYGITRLMLCSRINKKANPSPLPHL